MITKRKVFSLFVLSQQEKKEYLFKYEQAQYFAFCVRREQILPGNDRFTGGSKKRYMTSLHREESCIAYLALAKSYLNKCKKIRENHRLALVNKAMQNLPF